MDDPSEPVADETDCTGVVVAVVGKLSALPRREAQQLLRARGAVVVDTVDEHVQWIVLGEDEFPLGEWLDTLTDPLRAAIDAGAIEVLRETELWHRLGLIDVPRQIRPLHTPAMLAELLNVPISVIRRWHRRGLIVPARQVHRLPYFDFQEVSSARRLAKLLVAGISPRRLEAQLAGLRRWIPEVDRPLAQLSIIVQKKLLLLRHGAGLVEPNGQFQFDFESLEEPSDEAEPGDEAPSTPEGLTAWGAQREEAGDIDGAIACYRGALAAGGPRAETCFQLAELLYQQGDLPGARERYAMAIELDENYVEARANLGCIFAETGELELAVAAFEGALLYHPDYADVHYHLACTLDEMQRPAEAEPHWRAFLELAPDTPWSAAARERLQIAPVE